MKILLILALLLLPLSACRTPFDPGDEGAAGGKEVSIQYLKSLYVNRPLRITADYAIRGRVVSSDSAGNFRWTLIVEDATGGIEVKVGLSPYHAIYPVGQEVRIRCAGLVLGTYGRTIQLGADSEDARYETGFIDRERLKEHIAPTGYTETVTPTLLTPENRSMRWVDCAVQVERVRVIDEEQGLSWGDGEEYTERHLLFVDTPGDTLAVRTSPDALFAADPLPVGILSLDGVLTQFAGRYSLVLNREPGY
jgi:hypothetical protein